MMLDKLVHNFDRSQGADPAVATLSRRLGARAARGTLRSFDIGDRNSDLGLIEAYARNRIDVLPIDLGLATLAFWLARAAIDAESLLAWTAAALVGVTVRQLFVRRALLKAEAKTPPLRLRTQIILIEAFNGLVWAIAIFPFAQTSTAAPFVVGLILILRAGVEAFANATVPPAVCAALGPPAIGLVLYLACVYPGQDAGPLMALFALANLVFPGMASRQRRLLADKLSLLDDKSERVAELQRAKETSDAARRRAEEESLAKSRFIVTMSHELRTPLNAMLGFSEVLAGELYGPHENPTYGEYARDILGCGQHLLTLINDLIDLSRVEAGRYELREQRLSLINVVAECRHLLALRAQKSNISLIETTETDLPPLWGDLRAVRQIVLNLLTNAVKYTPSGGAVTIKVGWTSNGGQYVSVRDTGPGIPEDEIATVMACFGRGALAQKNAIEGAGLGLPIVKGLVELHGGEFFLKSHLNEGAEVVVVFPPQRVMNALPRYASDSHAA